MLCSERNRHGGWWRCSEAKQPQHEPRAARAMHLCLRPSRAVGSLLRFEQAALDSE
jgi:hypothetical protein